MFANPPRLFSNKENSTFPLTITTGTLPPHSGSPKPRVSGIGRAPKRSNRHQHGSKPYERISSIHKAKPLTRAAIKALKHAKPSTIDTTGTIASTSTAEEPSAPRKKTAKIPLRLPRPVIPPVRTNLPGLERIPNEYIMNRLTPQLPALLVVASAFRPFPQYDTVPLTAEDFVEGNPNKRATLAFGVPKLVKNNDEKIREKVEGREPDICLAIKGRDADSTEPARLVPVNQLVYAAQCSYWINSFIPPTPRSTKSAAPAQLPSPSKIPMERLDTIAEAPEEESTPTHAEEAESSDQDPDSSFDSEASGSSDATVVPKSSGPDGIIHLPIVHISIPSPKTFPILHTHLHLPERPFCNSLLDLPTSMDRSARIAVLQKLSVPELMEKLEYIHGVWKNVCALGVAGSRTWDGMSEAWSCVVGVLASRAVPVDKMDTSA